jgi:hypothetical protein
MPSQDAEVLVVHREWARSALTNASWGRRHGHSGLAAFKAGVTPSRIARQFGLSQSDVRMAPRLTTKGEQQSRQTGYLTGASVCLIPFSGLRKCHKLARTDHVATSAYRALPGPGHGRDPCRITVI